MPLSRTDDLDAAVDAQRARYPQGVRAVERLTTLAPMFRSAVRDMVRAYGETFFRRAEQRVREIDFLCDGDAARFDAAIQAYVRFCLEFVRKQAEFLKTGRYSFQDFDEMCRTLYEDEAAVRDFYLLALLLSFVFSPNYYEFYDFFEHEFLPQVPQRGTVIEVGCGHGVYLGQTLLHAPGLHGIGIDISAGALAVARRMLMHYGLPPARFELATDDLRHTLARADGSASAVICCEVLEHLPDPRHAVRELRRLLAADGVMMLSAAIRMESVDHLYVFRTQQEVIEMAESAGLRIVAERVVPLAKGNMLDRAERQRLADDPRVPVGYVCLARLR